MGLTTDLKMHKKNSDFENIAIETILNETEKKKTNKNISRVPMSTLEYLQVA